MRTGVAIGTASAGPNSLGPEWRHRITQRSWYKTLVITNVFLCNW